MALQYAILLALAFAGVVVAQSNNVLPWLRITAEQTRNNTKCKASDVRKIHEDWQKACWCFEVVHRELLPIKPQECDAMKTTVIDKLQCFLKEQTSEKQYKVVKSLDILFNMFHFWATELKEDEKYPEKFYKKITKCYDDKTEAKLTACTNSNLGEKDYWDSMYMSNILIINEAYYRGNGTTFKQCIMGVLLQADCDTIADDYNSLFDKAEAYYRGNGRTFKCINCDTIADDVNSLLEKAAASIPVTSFILIIGASLLSLYL